MSFAALRLHRLDLQTGRHLADLRTRHQQASALAVSATHLYAATDSRLLELDPTTLAISRQWDRGLVRYTKYLIPDGPLLVAANWLRPSVGIFDPVTGRTRRVQAGRQPLLVRHGGHVMVLCGFDGGMATLDTARGRLLDEQPTPPIAKASAGDEVWGIAAGPPKGGQGNPPVWTRAGTNALLRLTGTRVHVRLPADCSEVYCDDHRGLIWCLGKDLWAVAQDTGQVAGPYTAPRGLQIQYVSPDAGVVLATGPASHQVRANRLLSTKAFCACLVLP